MQTNEHVDLATWLTAVWDEEERLAIKAGGDRWILDGGIVHESHPSREVVDWVYDEADEHIAYHDPASVLARIAADRAILAEYVARDKDVDLMLGPDCERQREWSGLRLALRLKAEQYKSRPGFNPEWLDRSQGSRSHP